MSHCPQCGATLQEDSLVQGLCPHCLLTLGLLDLTREDIATEAELEPCAQFGPYKTLRVLGEGGMGIVYLAEQLRPIRRLVALKVIKLGMNSREVMARFGSERQALALMDHPNIAHVLDAGVSEQGQPYFAMEYVDGIHITDYCDQNRLSNRERMELFVQVCQAIEHAHQKGVIHRDIKPSNVLVSERDGKSFPKVIDFGIAKATDQRLAEYSAFTQFGQLVGTPEYMSPEQAELGGLNVDPSTDVYSLGILLYQLLVGVLPFEGVRLREAGLLEVLRVIREEEPPTPSNRLAGLKEIAEIAATRRTDPASMRRQLAGDLSWVVLKAIEKAKERRYNSAADLAGDVRRYLADQPVVARPPSLSYHLWKFARRHKALVGSIAATLAVLSIGVIVSLSQAARANHAELVASSERLMLTAILDNETRPDLAGLLSIENWRKLKTSLSERPLLLSLQANPRLLSSFTQTEAIYSIALSPDGKILAAGGDDWSVWLWDVDSRRLLGRLNGHTDRVNSVAFSPDGKWLASGGYDQTIRLWDVAERRPHGPPLRSNAGFVLGVRFSPDGKFLAAACQLRTVKVWELNTANPPRVFSGHSEMVVGVAFSGDGRVLASAGFDRTVRLWDLQDGQPQGLSMTGTRSVFAVAFSPSGKLLASGGDDLAVHIWDRATHQEIGPPLLGHVRRIRSLAFSDDGKLLVSSSDDRTLRLWDLSTRRQLGDALRGHANPVVSVAFVPHSHLLASAGEDGKVRLWKLAATESSGETLVGHQANIWDVAFSPDGRMLASASADKTIRLWHWQDQKQTALLEGHTALVSSVAFSPDGEFLASGSDDRTIRLWDWRNQKQTALFQGHTAPINGIAFNPNGNLLISTSIDKTIRLWDWAKGVQVGELKGHTQQAVADLAFSPDGKLLATVGLDHMVRLWDVTSRTQKCPPMGDGHSGNVLSVAFSPNGKLLASGSDDRKIWFWDVAGCHAAGDPVRENLAGTVTALKFSPDGSILASAAELDNTVQLWDVASRQPLGNPLTGPTNGITSLAFSPDGRTLAAGTLDKTVMLWDVDPNSWAARLCLIANRNLSLHEWQQFFGPRTPYRRTCPALPPGEGAPAS